MENHASLLLGMTDRDLSDTHRGRPMRLQYVIRLLEKRMYSGSAISGRMVSVGAQIKPTCFDKSAVGLYVTLSVPSMEFMKPSPQNTSQYVTIRLIEPAPLSVHSTRSANVFGLRCKGAIVGMEVWIGGLSSEPSVTVL